MAKAKTYVPEGIHTITPILCVDGTAEAIELYKKAFGAVEHNPPAPDPSGKKIWHAEVRIGNSVFFINDPMPGMEAWISRNWLYVEDVDAWFKRAVGAGLKGEMEPADMFWGDRHARVSDKFGNVWALATHTDDFTEEEVIAKQAAFVASMHK